MKDGVLLIDKPAGISSHDVVGKIRRLYQTRQVGHTGTLDPMATGLLPVLVGRAVKAQEYLTEHDKTYLAELTLGYETDTEDSTGEVLSRSDLLPTREEVEAVLPSFRGEIRQVPPMYSALKVGGETLYRLARRGVTVEREARAVVISKLDLSVLDEKKGRYALTVSCSKGTYIRTLCADIGRMLGCGGVMSALRRVQVGAFPIDDAITLEALNEATPEAREARLLPTESLFEDCPIVKLPPFYARLAQAGCEIYQKKLGVDYPLGTRVRLYDESFFSLGEVRAFEGGTAIKPIKKFRLDGLSEK